jgi:cellulose synthase/poly-beta-1,6-N-acetylglucosamine synthase-like glycosyltransferase
MFYSTVGYAALLLVVARFIHRPVTKAEITPTVSLLIAAHNEESVIAKKIENTLALDYPRERIQVIVVSDTSTDRTEEITLGFSGKGIVLFRVPDGKGKVHALNEAMHLVTGDIVVISDADSMYAPDALRKLVRNFADAEVGAVTGEERRVATDSDEGRGESLYCRLDNQIKRLEGQLGSMVMVNGGFFAIRRELYPILPPHLIHDSIVPCRLKLEGYRTAYEREAHSVETYPLESSDDFRRRFRTVLQAFTSYLSSPGALNPFRTGSFALKLFSHRFSRWFVSFWQIIALACNILLLTRAPMYRVLMIAQAVCYGSALVGWALDLSGRRFLPFYLPYYFVYVHFAAFLAVLQAVFGKRMAKWTPAKRVWLD